MLAKKANRMLVRRISCGGIVLPTDSFLKANATAVKAGLEDTIPLILRT
jgi:hypothetical protein